MKLKIAGAALLAASTLMIAAPSFAQTNTSGSQSGASSVINSVNPAQAPSAIAPGLVAGGLSCSGSASIGGSGGGWGLSIGMTKEDQHCNAREDAKYIDGILGDKNSAKARLCMVKENREAFALAGQPCPQDLVRQARGVPVSTQPAQPRTFRNMRACQEWATSQGRSPEFCQRR